MSELEYSVVACAIKKADHVERYGEAAIDPYMLSLDVLVERFCFDIGDVEEGGEIVAETRSPVLDRQLGLAWESLKTKGIRFLGSTTIKRRISALRLRSKQSNVAGMELADLVVSPIGRFVLNMPTKEDWTIVESKLRRRGGSYLGAGLVVLPKPVRTKE